MIKLKHVLVFLKYQDEILLLNRNKPSWMGCWNGVGGKIENGESPVEAAIRETFEETGIKVKIKDEYNKVAWVVKEDKDSLGGMYVFIQEIDEKIKTPAYSPEGVLDFKKIDWILDERNSGVAKNIKVFLPVYLECIKQDYITIYGQEFDDLEIIEKVDLGNINIERLWKKE